MHKTNSFVKLDILTVKPFLTVKTLLLLSVVCLGITLMLKEPFLVAGMLMMYGVIYTSYPFAVGEKNGIDTLYLTLPLHRRQVVTGRYLFAVLLELCSAGIAAVFSAAFYLYTGKAFALTEILLLVGPCFFLFTMVSAVQLPIYFRLGYAKAKFLSYLPLAIFPLAVMLISSLMGEGKLQALVQQLLTWSQANAILAGVLCIALWTVLMLFSWRLSCVFYQKREF